MKIEVPFSENHNLVKIVLRSPVNGESAYEVESSALTVEINNQEWESAEEVVAYFCGPSGEPDAEKPPVLLKDRSEYAPPKQETTNPATSAGNPAGNDGNPAADLPAGNPLSDEGRSTEPVSEAGDKAEADTETANGSSDEAAAASVTNVGDVTIPDNGSVQDILDEMQSARESQSSDDLSDEELESLTKPVAAAPPSAPHLRD